MNRFTQSLTRANGTAFSGLAAILLLAAACMAYAGPPTVYTVGNIFADSDCHYLSLRGALQAAAEQASGDAEIHLLEGTDVSLSYSFGAFNSQVDLINVAADIEIIGGYDDCGAFNPVAGQYTELGFLHPDADGERTMLSIYNDASNPRRFVRLRQIRMQGGASPDVGPAQGGGVRVSGNATLILDDSSIAGFSADNGGGVYLTRDNSVPENQPYLTLTNSGVVEDNHAWRGGGIYSYYGRVVMRGGAVRNNTASISGGGIYLKDYPDLGDALDSDYALLLDSGESANYITGNTAVSVDPTDDSRGGGVYSVYGQIRSVSDSNASFGFQSYISLNHANKGGGMYIAGPIEAAGGPYTVVRLRDVWFGGNEARSKGGALYLANAVDADIIGADDDCSMFGIIDWDPPAPPLWGTVPTLCVMFSGNKALGTDDAGEIPRGGAIYLNNSRSDGMSRAIVHVYGALFSGNSDAEGLAAVAAAEGASEFVFKRNIFIGNSAKTGSSLNVPSALLYSHTGKDVLFQHNTVLDSNSSTRMFNIAGGNLDVTGSILWGTVDRGHPFHFVWYASDGATMTHNDCLLVRTNDDGMAGIPDASTLWLAGYEPRLGARYTPSGDSPALDVCDNLGNPGVDAYGRGNYDVPGIGNGWGIYDLGAVEQTDIIFANHFGYQPTN